MSCRAEFRYSRLFPAEQEDPTALPSPANTVTAVAASERRERSIQQPIKLASNHEFVRSRRSLASRLVLPAHPGQQGSFPFISVNTSSSVPFSNSRPLVSFPPFSGSIFSRSFFGARPTSSLFPVTIPDRDRGNFLQNEGDQIHFQAV